ncbi:Transcription factor [Penicillium mononematosum]|uniref:Transcription factor n=1 Tax=Penicillium mononematosum TaxID=268346 RepID=UPI0025468E11|nr:Transcription factor [Penicillium mononematosum]KAJ6190261.1 Transcription factor [Penicillium mononematosum]
MHDSAAEIDVESRLERLEHAVRQLTDSVNRALQTITSASPQTDTGISGPVCRTIPTKNVGSESRLHTGLSHSCSFLDEASANIDAIRQSSGNTTSQNAHSELQYLSGRLTTTEVEQQVAQDSATFYIPSKAIGYRLIGRFLEDGELGEPFFSFPSDDVVRQVVFEPHKVRERGWIAYFNYTMLCIVSNENGENSETKNFRRNVQLALNDSSIFLEPCLVNVQALCFLAMHGEDYAAPNLSWMLLGHACRQAQALGLHSPTHQDTDSRQQRLCLFWLLFLIDKSCSLSFSRPAFLPTAFYHNVPLPDRSFLLKFKPHERAWFVNGQPSVYGSRYGSEFFTHYIQWAKLAGSVVDLLATDGSIHRKQEIRSSLETWYLDTNQSLTAIAHAESASASASQMREMNLGISTMKFQYLNSLILLLKGDDSSSNLRLSSAREAISTLSFMVSNWSSVYNGVVWQLLYCPFTPFFVIFGNIVNNDSPQIATVEQDLSLLSATVDYFVAMRSQMRLLATVCSRLQHTASVFLQLARTHVSGRVLTQTYEKPANPFQPPPTQPTYTYGQHPEDLMDLDLGELDVSNYLEWLPADMGSAWPIFDTNRPDMSSRLGNKRPSQGSGFDWFSWDTYYSGAET